MYNGLFEQIKCSYDVTILVVLDFDVLYELEPATHIQIQIHFNDSIADTSILFMITVTVILLMLRFMMLNLMNCCDLMISMMINYVDCTVRRLMRQTKFTLICLSDNFDYVYHLYCILYILTFFLCSQLDPPYMWFQSARHIVYFRINENIFMRIIK